MRRYVLLGAAGLGLIVATFSPLRADHQRGTLGERSAPGYKQRYRHDPFSRHYADFLPAGPRNYGGYYSPGFGHPGSYSPGYYGGGFSYGYYGPYDFGYGGGYPGPIYGSGYGYPSVYSGQGLFGPDLDDLWNLGVQPPRPQINVLVAPPDDVPVDRPGDAGERRRTDRVRVANAEATARSWRFIEFGDRYFTRQDYRQAYQRYKEAAEAAPNFAEAYLRQGQAMLATGQHAIAAISFKRALKMAPDWSQVRFDIAELYADRAAARKAHLENLAQAAEQDPGNADLWLLLGIQLHFSGEPDRARPFFARATDVLAVDDPELARVVAVLATEPVAADGGEQEEDVELRF